MRVLEIRLAALTFAGSLAVIVGGTGCAGQGVASSPPGAAPVGGAALPINITDTLTQLGSMPPPKGVPARTWAELTGALGEALRARAASALALRPPGGQDSSPVLTYSASEARINWGYFSPGDYDQNGEVGLPDLVPLAVHFGESTGTGDPFPEESIRAVIDGDGNGEINLGDIASIAANFGVHLEGYHVYSAGDTADCPASADDPNGPGAEFIGGVAFGDIQEPPGGGRKQFSHHVVPTQTARYYWVRPFEGLVDGAASNYVLVQLPPNPERAPVAVLANTATAETPAHIIWNAWASYDPNPNDTIVRFEWDFNYDGVFEHDSGLDPALDYYYYAPGMYACTVRVTDNNGNTGTAMRVVTVNEKAKWHVNLADERAALVENDYTLSKPRQMVDAGGRPGLFYMRNTAVWGPLYMAELSVVYTVALDEHGESWATPVILATQAPDQTVPGGDIKERLDLQPAAIVEGRPAVVFSRTIQDWYVTQPGQIIFSEMLYYLRADDEFGGSWPQPLTINYAQFYAASLAPIFGTYFGATALLVVRHRPALLGRGLEGDYQWLSAQDGTGSTWAERVVLADSQYLRGFPLGDKEILTTIGGLPARACSASQDILYWRAINPDQPDWLQPPVLVDEHEKAADHIQLVEVAGYPAVVYYDSATDDLKYRRALDPLGSAWAGPVVLSPRAISGGFLAAVVDGRPCVIYGDRIDKTARFIAANDVAGTYWGFPMVLWEPPDSGNTTGYLEFLSSIAAFVDVAGAPALCLTDSVSGEDPWGKDQILYESYY